MLHVYKIKFMINNIQYNLQNITAYSRTFLKKFLNIINILIKILAKLFSNFLGLTEINVIEAPLLSKPHGIILKY